MERAACAVASSETNHVLVTTPLLAMPVNDLAPWMRNPWHKKRTTVSTHPKLRMRLSVASGCMYYEANGADNVNTAYPRFSQTLDAELQRKCILTA